MKKKLKYFLVTLLVLFLLVTVVAVLYIYNFPQLRPWHTYIPKEMTVAELDKADWQEYLDHEDRLFKDIRREVVEKVPKEEKNPVNRYYENGRIYPPKFKEDWNRSYTFIPEKPKGAVVLLHGLTDTPYSQRHIAKIYKEKGFAVLGLRTPGHGTVPGALTAVTWQEWMAAVRLAMREAHKVKPEGTPLHLVGFSKGGALAVKYVLESLEDKKLATPDKVILISPMLGITRLSKVAEIISIPSILPGLSKAAWISVVPEFNPFKYNSFPANGARQARLLIAEVRRQMAVVNKSGAIKDFPPTITFQSIVDYTVSMPAVINNLYSHLPANGSELVVFDINRYTAFMPLMRPVFINMLEKMLPPLPQDYRITVIGNGPSGNSMAVEKTFMPGETTYTTRELGLVYPPDVFSLSHIALSFPESDSLYGSRPDPENKDEFGLNLGVIANAQGERGVLEIGISLFFRISSNPLFPYIAERIYGVIDDAKAKMPPAVPVKKAKSSKSGISDEEYDALMKESGYEEEVF